MTITPLAAAAVPAGIAALKLAQHVRQEQPFRQLLSQIASGPQQSEAKLDAEPAGDELPQFHALVQERLATAGIRTSMQFEITSDPSGQLHVEGDLARRAEIERVLRGDPDIAAAFHRVAAQHQLSQAAQRHQQFAEQYAADPQGAAAKMPVHSKAFAIRIDGDDIEIR